MPQGLHGITHFLVLDVESIGLFGEGFAWASVLVDLEGNHIEEYWVRGDHKNARGAALDYAWITENVLPALDAGPVLVQPLAVSLVHMRNAFLCYFAKVVERFPGVVLVADCPFPVEANFLLTAFCENPDYKHLSPYPLIDVASHDPRSASL